MDKLPLLGSWRDFLTNQKKHLKDVVDKKEWVVLISYILVAFFVLCVVFFGSVATIYGGITAWRQIWPKENTMPPRTLRYERADVTKNADGQFVTTFSIFVHTPAGQTNPDYVVGVARDLQEKAECSYTEREKIVEVGSGLASTTQHLLMGCITKEKIIDNGNLFIIMDLSMLK